MGIIFFKGLSGLTLMSAPIQNNLKDDYRHFLLLDDHEIVRFGVRQMIRQEWPASKVYDAETFLEADRILRRHHIQVLISDVKVPGQNPGESVATIRQFASRVPVIVFSMYPKELFDSQLGQSLVQAYICKNDGIEYLRDALKRVMDGRTGWTPPEQVEQESPFSRLSAQEFHVAMAMVHGKSNAEICTAFGLKPSTVSTYKNRIYEKLNVENYSGILKLAYAHGIDFNDG